MQVISENNQDALNTACDFLKAGKLIAFATDTVYGIACDATNSKAVDDLFCAKERDFQKPIAIFVKDIKQAQEILFFDEKAQEIAQKYLPGKLTIVLEAKENSKLAKNLNSTNNSLGFRIVDNKFISNLLHKFDGILAVSSANISKQQPALKTADVEKNFSNSKLALLIKPEKENQSSQVSTVIKIKNNQVQILRNGAIKIT